MFVLSFVAYKLYTKVWHFHHLNISIFINQFIISQTVYSQNCRFSFLIVEFIYKSDFRTKKRDKYLLLLNKLSHTFVLYNNRYNKYP